MQITDRKINLLRWNLKEGDTEWMEYSVSHSVNVQKDHNYTFFPIKVEHEAGIIQTN